MVQNAMKILRASEDYLEAMLMMKEKHGYIRSIDVAEQLGVPELVLYHTEDKSIENRKALYTEEGRQYYHGSLIVPDDLETLEL